MLCCYYCDSLFGFRNESWHLNELSRHELLTPLYLLHSFISHNQSFAMFNLGYLEHRAEIEPLDLLPSQLSLIQNQIGLLNFIDAVVLP